MDNQLFLTPLHGWHRDAGAKMASFAGWEMPIQYRGGAIAEHHLVRRSAGLFDVSHMGQFRISGTGAGGFLDATVTSAVGGLSPGRSAYGLLCRDNGTVVDDVFVYRLDDHWLMVVNAANRAKDLTWLTERLSGSGTAMNDISEATAMFALQGPRAIEIAEAFFGMAVGAVPRFGATTASAAGVEALIGRTGYTGEDGIELFVAIDCAEQIWTGILDTARERGIECGPIGLAARDSLRFEPGFPLYGHEIDDQTTPVEARLTWACAMEKEFVGRAAIQEQLNTGVTRRLVTVRMVDRGVPRAGNPVLHAERIVGGVASGMYAPTLDGYYANAFVPPGVAKVGTNVEIEIRGQRKAAVVVKRPLYTPSYRQ